MEQHEPSSLVGMQNGVVILEDSLAGLTELNILLPYDLAITFLGIYPNELKTYVHTKTSTQMFTVALFIMAKTWKQPRHPLVGEWINCGISKQWTIIQC